MNCNTLLFQHRAKWSKIPLVTNSRKRASHSILQLFLVLSILFGQELWIWDEVLVASEEEKVSEKSTGTNGLPPTPPTEGCCLNPGVFGELKLQCWLPETILSGLISSISQWRVPIQCYPLLLCCDLCHPPIYRTVSGQFLSWKVSLRLFHPPSPTPSPPFPSSLLSVLLCLLLLKSYCKISALTHCDAPPPQLYNVLKPISVNFLNLELDRSIY